MQLVLSSYPKREHISPHLAFLHWLPIDSRIKYKLACICYSCMSTNSPPYLSDLLTVYTAARQLRSSSDNSVLRRPSVRTVSYAGVDLGGIPLSRAPQIFRRNTRFAGTVIRPDYQLLPRFGDPILGLASLD